MRSLIYSGLIICSLALASVCAEKSNAEERMQDTGTVYRQESIRCPEVLRVLPPNKENSWESRLADVLAPNLPVEFRDTFTIESNNINPDEKYLLHTGHINYKDGQIASLRCSFVIGDEPAKVTVTIKQKPDATEGSSKPLLPYAIAGTRAVITDEYLHGDSNCGANLPDHPDCAIAPMFMVVLNKAVFHNLYPNTIHGNTILVETAGKKRQIKTPPVPLKQRDKSGKRSYIPYREEVTAFKVKLDTSDDLEDWTHACLPEGMNKDRIPVSAGASAVIRIEGKITESGKAKDISCDMHCGKDSMSASCWKRRHNYQCNIFYSGLNAIAGAISGVLPVDCWVAADKASNSSRLYTLVEKSTQVDPHELLEIDPGKYHSQYSIKHVTGKYKIHPDQCRRDDTYEDLCKEVYRKITTAKETLIQRKSEKEKRKDTGLNPSQPRKCVRDDNGDLDPSCEEL